jgi:hypothetical protein
MGPLRKLKSNRMLCHSLQELERRKLGAIVPPAAPSRAAVRVFRGWLVQGRSENATIKATLRAEAINRAVSNMAAVLVSG